jgi:predicted nucleotidyltransferase
MDERRFKATRINVFGQIVETEFALKEAQRITSGHPFASVKIRGANFYIFGGRIEEKELRHRLTNEI